MGNEPSRAIAFGSQEELRDLLPRFSEIFSVTDFQHDSENEWEWLEGVSDELLRVNISRYHNLDENNKTFPILIRIGFGNLAEERYVYWAQRLADEFDAEITLGHGWGRLGSLGYEFIAVRVFKKSS